MTYPLVTALAVDGIPVAVASQVLKLSRPVNGPDDDAQRPTMERAVWMFPWWVPDRATGYPCASLRGVMSTTLDTSGNPLRPAALSPG